MRSPPSTGQGVHDVATLLVVYDVGVLDVVVGVALGVSGVVVAYLVLVAASCYVFLFCLVLVLLLCCVVFDL